MQLLKSAGVLAMAFPRPVKGCRLVLMKGAVVFCVNCGAGRVAGGAFCASCGSSFEAPPLAGESAASPADQAVTTQLPVTPALSPTE